jgi:hypothetical protein
MACSYDSRNSELTPDSNQEYTPPPTQLSVGNNLEQELAPTRALSAAISKAVLKALFDHSLSLGLGRHRRGISCRGSHGANGNLECSRFSRAQS